MPDPPSGGTATPRHRIMHSVTSSDLSLPARTLLAQEGASDAASGVDQVIEAVVGPIATLLSAIVFFEIPMFGGVPVIVLWLMAAAVFITV